MRKITKIILHCAATPEGVDFTIDDIRLWHTTKPPKGNGWRDIGYHFVIHLDGSVHAGRPLEEIGAHVSGHNSGSIGVCYIGGCDKDGNPKDTRTPEQKIAMRAVVSTLMAAFPAATVHGHNEFAKKACPCFDVRKEFYV
ncbi:N-acetylmuramoyl-L-alanine amidase [Dysgonomonas sp. 521]|uniref:N-acetylmuramoyl-L-alanine amidase n=1 Tax=Dysgonomonas sp. 521 TaxID=2302932 RepID=UPI00162AE9C0|nr:N-acetylmuramoyl-L-alanine amidase [Dysgonomonas sp. 521]